MVEPSFIEHNGKRLLRLDFRGLTPPEIIAYMQKAMRVIAAEPHRSARLLSLVTKIHVTNEVVTALEEFATHNAPFVLVSAIVGATPFQKAAMGLTITSRGRLNVDMFDDEGEAKDWLAAR